MKTPEEFIAEYYARQRKIALAEAVRENPAANPVSLMRTLAFKMRQALSAAYNHAGYVNNAMWEDEFGREEYIGKLKVLRTWCVALKPSDLKRVRLAEQRMYEKAVKE